MALSVSPKIMDTTDKIDPLPRLCRHIRPFALALMDDSLRGFRRWLVNLHVARCPQCQSALKAMAEMVARLRAGNREEEAPSASAAGLGRERWAQMEAAWEQAENRHRPEAPPDR